MRPAPTLLLFPRRRSGLPATDTTLLRRYVQGSCIGRSYVLMPLQGQLTITRTNIWLPSRLRTQRRPSRRRMDSYRVARRVPTEESRPTYQPNQKPNPTRPDGGGSPTSEQRPSVLRTQRNQTESGQIPSGFPSLQISPSFIHPDVANRKILTTLSESRRVHPGRARRIRSFRLVGIAALDRLVFAQDKHCFLPLSISYAVLSVDPNQNSPSPSLPINRSTDSKEIRWLR
jgi:hypothetical protein